MSHLSLSLAASHGSLPISHSLTVYFAMPGILGQLGGLPLLVLMFVAMYFLLISPQQRKQKQWQAMLSQLKAGDKVTTNGGIRGTIVSVKDDVLVIRTAPDGIKLEFAKNSVAAVTTEEPAKDA